MDLQDQGMDSQDPDMYFTNLSSGNSLVNLSDSLPLPSSNSTNVKRSMRGTNFTSKEDELLVSAWLNCSFDAIKGTYQNSSHFWAQIFKYFHEHKETTIERSVKSLTQRWSCIQKATNSFCSYLDQVKGVNQSGITQHDKFDKAKIIYQSIEMLNFQFEHCWHILKDEPKWNSRLTKSFPKQRKTMVPTPTLSPSQNCDVIDNGVVELDRPMGRKAAKRKRMVETMKPRKSSK
ncbi:glutathione S-transferase T3-like [Bidens hawaiensis]|uniref:glutathione S-transferase T3-like n=1 Tax=Bidens hawaiensis TaxID=980011 RepID=UPI00404ACFE6